MSEFTDTPDLGAIAQAGLDVKALTEHPGWAVLEAKLEGYVESQLNPMIGGANEDVSKYAFTCGRIRAFKLDFKSLVKETITAGENAERERQRQEQS